MCACSWPNARTTRMPDRVSCEVAGDRADRLARQRGRRRPTRSGSDRRRPPASGSTRNVEQRQLPVEDEQDHDHADQRQRRTGSASRGRRSTSWSSASTSLVSRRDEHAGAVALVEAEREPLQVAEERGGAGRRARAGRPSRRGRSGRRSATAYDASPTARNRTTIRSSAPTSWLSGSPRRSRAWPAARGASAAAVAATSEMNIASTRQR